MKITECKNLVEGEIVEVKGSLMYTKYFTKRLCGEELERQIANDSQFSDYPNENPRFTFQLFSPAVVKKGDKPTDAEIYVKSKIYESKDGTKILRCEKTAKSEKAFLLTGIRQADGKIKKVNLTGKFLENDQPATVQYQVQKYKKKTTGKDAYTVQLFAVVFDEEPKFWTPSNTGVPEGWEADDDEVDTPKTNESAAPAADDNVWSD